MNRLLILILSDSLKPFFTFRQFAYFIFGLISFRQSDGSLHGSSEWSYRTPPRHPQLTSSLPSYGFPNPATRPTPAIKSCRAHYLIIGPSSVLRDDSSVDVSLLVLNSRSCGSFAIRSASPNLSMFTSLAFVKPCRTCESSDAAARDSDCSTVRLADRHHS